MPRATTASPYDSQPTPTNASVPITRFRDGNRFLSNFWFVPQGVSFDQMTGPTVEHVFQAAKTLDRHQRGAILNARTALEAKTLGQKVDLRPDWEFLKLGVMAALQGSKYSDPQLAALLIATDNAHLEEGNHWHDTFWGVCSCSAHDAVGENWLGRLLMIKRSLLLA
ncbi:NADAR family protein [Cryobacterium zhongshanensis]|uniref:NADAR family protein n=1 Tax=Cryobacterium zhongshanensis TaxID=2928153 RepID=UPI001FAA2D6A|nr:NADAR family protein [Cryobacterium zhongshanensis]